MINLRRKGVAIIETNKGILVVAGKNRKFTLPGGGAKIFETGKKATIREIYEETELKTKKIKYLFRYVGNKWHNFKGKLVKNKVKVFLIISEGKPKPKKEIKYIKFWNSKSKVKISKSTKESIEKYYKLKNK